MHKTIFSSVRRMLSTIIDLMVTFVLGLTVIYFLYFWIAPIPESDKEFDKYRSMMSDLCTKYDDTRCNNLTNVAMFFTEGEFHKENVIAMCVKLPLTKHRYAIFRKDMWEEMDDDEKEYLVIHELGHCVLDRHHVNGVVETEDGGEYNLSIMSSYMPEDISMYVEMKDYYFDELFLLDFSNEDFFNNENETVSGGPI